MANLSCDPSDGDVQLAPYAIHRRLRDEQPVYPDLQPGWLTWIWARARSEPRIDFDPR